MGNLAGVLNNLRDYKAAERWLQEGFKKFTRSISEKMMFQFATTLGNSAGVLRDLGDNLKEK